jgi:hypothetical protein
MWHWRQRHVPQRLRLATGTHFRLIVADFPWISDENVLETMQVNTTRYPDMKAMTAKAHSLGLRAGFYMNTCECREEGWAPDKLLEHYQGDTSFLFEMGFDNVKIDSCSEFHDLALWEQLLNKTGRPYIIEDCFQGGVVGNLSWCPFTHFRSGGDLSQGWNDIANKLQQVRPYTRNLVSTHAIRRCLRVLGLF